jgi:hypothetical protein
MATYYALLWGMAGLNAVRCLLQMLHAGSTTSSPGHAALWNTFWLLTRFGMMMLEASVVVFLLQQGHAASGRQVRERGGCSGRRCCTRAAWLALP